MLWLLWCCSPDYLWCTVQTFPLRTSSSFLQQLEVWIEDRSLRSPSLDISTRLRTTSCSSSLFFSGSARIQWLLHEGHKRLGALPLLVAILWVSPSSIVTFTPSSLHISFMLIPVCESCFPVRQSAPALPWTEPSLSSCNAAWPTQADPASLFSGWNLS